MLQPFAVSDGGRKRSMACFAGTSHNTHSPEPELREFLLEIHLILCRGHTSVRLHLQRSSSADGAEQLTQECQNQRRCLLLLLKAVSVASCSGDAGGHVLCRVSQQPESQQTTQYALCWKLPQAHEK